jgi:translocation and assembly module TamA
LTDRALLGALGATLLLLAPSAAAQDRGAAAELKDLIPDSAVDSPEAWAQSHEAAPAPINPQPEPESPLTEDGGFRLPWPEQQLELPELLALEPDAESAALSAQLDQVPAMREAGQVEQLSSRLSLVFPADPVRFPEREEFIQRFASLSSIENLSGGGEDNAAQLGVRARTDSELLRRLLRIYGYYDAEIDQTVSGIVPGEEAAVRQPSVRFAIDPGARYRFGLVELGDLPETGSDFPALRSSFGIQTGDPLNSDRIVTSRTALDNALGESGYAFAMIGEPDLLVDHRREEGDLTVPLSTGGRYAFGPITSELPKFMSGDHLEDIARFDAGDVYKRSQVDDLRRAIIATGLVSSVGITPRETAPPQGEAPGTVALDVTMTPAPLRTIAGAVGYDSAEGFRAEASWEHRNLFPPEGMLRVRAIGGTKEQLAGVTFRRNNFHGRDQVLTLDLYANTVNRDAYIARTAALSATFEKVTTLIFQKPWVWSGGLEFIATNEAEGDVGGIEAPRRTYYIAALPLRAAFDTTDNLLDPTKGFRAALKVSPELALRDGGTSSYARIQADASAYLPIAKRAILAGRIRVGTIPGTAIENIAPSRRFYAGGGGSVRGYGYQQIGPRDSLGAPSGGRSLTELSIEARIKTGLFGGAVSVVPFLDAGSVDTSITPRLRDMRYGAGLGLRYQTGFGPIRIDVGTPLNRRPGDSRVAVYVSLGQAF